MLNDERNARDCQTPTNQPTNQRANERANERVNEGTSEGTAPSNTTHIHGQMDPVARRKVNAGSGRQGKARQQS